MEEIKKADIEKTETILVDLDKIEKLVNKVADLVITNSMMSQKIDNLNDEEDKRNMSGITTLFERHIKEIQDYAMELRMINMASIYEKFPLLIESTANKYNKKIQINTSGNNTKIDKSMLESLDETLKLILENSVIHGIEEPKIRIEKQKNEIGLISVNTEQINGQIVITIKDDGKGIDLESIVNNALEKRFINEDDLENMSDNDKSALILNEKSMSKVKEYVEKINGQLFIETKKDRGTTVTIFIPLTLSILDGLNIRIGEQYFILPTTSIIESLQPTKDIIKSVGDGSSELLILREDFIPIIRMNEYLKIEGQHTNLTDGMIIVVKAGKEKVALFIDEFLHQQQIVVKAIDRNFRDVIGISGATVRGNGSIGLIIDVKSIVDDKR